MLECNHKNYLYSKQCGIPSRHEMIILILDAM